jgi:hypothetical protein
MKVSIKNSIVNELHQPTHSDIAAVALINQTVTTGTNRSRLKKMPKKQQQQN